jgi:hypothetical protein
MKGGFEIKSFLFELVPNGIRIVRTARQPCSSSYFNIQLCPARLLFPAGSRSLALWSLIFVIFYTVVELSRHNETCQVLLFPMAFIKIWKLISPQQLL